MAQDISHAAYPALRALWVFIGITFVFVVLRFYIRHKVLEGFKADDHFYFASFVCLLIYASLVQASARHGLGRNIWEIDSPDDISRAILYEIIGQTFLIIGNVTSKLSIVFFLKNLSRQLVHTLIHKLALWTPVALFGITVTIALCVSWFSCQPIAHRWDPRVDGHCNDHLGPVNYLAGAMSVFVDVSYAIYPWCLLWRFNIPPKKKYVILISLTLGIAAAICGVKRAIELKRLGSPNFTKDTVELITWHAAELAVTLIAIGIPICFPLYKVFNWAKNRSGFSGGVYGMNTIGGSSYSGNGANPRQGGKDSLAELVGNGDAV